MGRTETGDGDGTRSLLLALALRLLLALLLEHLGRLLALELAQGNCRGMRSHESAVQLDSTERSGRMG